jgi:hypothetical protein
MSIYTNGSFNTGSNVGKSYTATNPTAYVDGSNFTGHTYMTITVGMAGTYLITAQTGCYTSGSGGIIIYIKVGGTTIVTVNQEMPGGAHYMVGCQKTYTLSAGDIITVVADMTSASGNREIGGDNNYPGYSNLIAMKIA